MVTQVHPGAACPFITPRQEQQVILLSYIPYPAALVADPDWAWQALEMTCSWPRKSTSDVNQRLAMRRCGKLQSPIVIRDSANSVANVRTMPVWHDQASSRSSSDDHLAARQDENQNARAQCAEAGPTTETHITQPSPPSQRQRLNRFERTL